MIKKCCFNSCSADAEGGAIHTSSIRTLDVTESLFRHCSSTVAYNDHGSGAIWIYGIHQKLSILNNCFISCTSKSSGGAFLIQDCTSQVTGELINSCRFLDCNATDETPDGGAVCIWTNSVLIRIVSSLFSTCFSGDNGGAIRHRLNGYSTQSYPVRYCFFNKNLAPLGNDIYFDYIPSDAPCLYCFSTTQENRIGYYSNNDYHFDKDAWLPLGTLLSLNTRKHSLTGIVHGSASAKNN